MHASDRLADRQSRLAAAGLVAVVSVTIASVAHAAVGGGTPSIVAIALALLVSGTVGTIVVGPRITRSRALAGVVLDQVVFHTLFAFFGSSSVNTVSGPLGLHGAHSDHSLIALAPRDASAATSSASMLIVHIAAAVIAYGMLRRGVTSVESITRALLTALARVLDTATTPAPLLSPLRLSAMGTNETSLSRTLLRLPDRRGPPTLAAL